MSEQEPPNGEQVVKIFALKLSKQFGEAIEKMIAGLSEQHRDNARRALSMACHGQGTFVVHCENNISYHASWTSHTNLGGPAEAITRRWFGSVLVVTESSRETLVECVPVLSADEVRGLYQNLASLCEKMGITEIPPKTLQ